MVRLASHCLTFSELPLGQPLAFFEDTSCDFLQKRQGETRWGFGALARVICETLGNS